MAEMSHRELSDIESLKALAHPLRQRILGWLQRNGPATSAELASTFDEDRGATSYHLRQLARFGFIEEDATRSAGRRKYWRPVPQDLRLPRHSESTQAAEAVDVIGRWWLGEAERDLAQYLADREAFGEFATTAAHSLGGLRLTSTQLAEFGSEYLDFLNRWHSRTSGEASDGSRPITVIFHAFPTPDPTDPA